MSHSRCSYTTCSSNNIFSSKWRRNYTQWLQLGSLPLPLNNPSSSSNPHYSKTRLTVTGNTERTWTFNAQPNHWSSETSVQFHFRTLCRTSKFQHWLNDLNTEYWIPLDCRYFETCSCLYHLRHSQNRVANWELEWGPSTKTRREERRWSTIVVQEILSACCSDNNGNSPYLKLDTLFAFQAGHIRNWSNSND